MSELEIWNELGNLYFSTGVHDKAIHAYLKAIELDPECAQSYGNLATIYTRQGRYAEAIPLYQKAVALLTDPGDQALLWTCMGDAYRQIDDPDNAAASYLKAGELDPQAAAPAPLHPPCPEPRDDGTRAGQAEEPSAPPARSMAKVPPPEAVRANDEGVRASEAGPGSGRRDADEDNQAGIAASPMRLGGSLFSDTSEDGQEAIPLAIPADPEPSSPASADPRPACPAQDEALTSGAGRKLSSGMLLWRKGELEKASETLTQALALARKLNDSWLEALCLDTTAHVDADLEKYDEAIRGYEQAAALAPEHIFPWNNLGLLYNKIGLYQKALEAFQAAVERCPHDPVTWNGLGDTYHKLGRQEDAIAAYQRGNSSEKKSTEKDSAVVCQMVLKADPENVQVWAELANIYFDDGAYEDAIDTYRRVVALLGRPKDKAIVWHRIGEAYTRLEDLDSAVVACQKAVELDPDTTAYLEALARARRAQEGLVRSGQTEPESAAVPALADLSAAGGRPPGTPAQAGPAPVSLPAAAGPEPGQAFWVFEPSAAIGTRFSPAPRSGRAARTSRQPEPTADVLTEERPLGLPPPPAPQAAPLAAAADASVQTMPWQGCGAAEPPAGGKRGRQEPSEEDSIPITIVETGPQSTGPMSHSLDNDIAAYRRVTELNPKNDRAWDALGNMLLEVDLYQEAVTALERALALKPHKDVYHYHLGLAYASRDRYADAVKAMRRVVELNPAHTLAHCNLARYYRKLGESALADQHLAIVRPSMENENEYNRACFESIGGNVEKALGLLGAALEKKQVQASWARSDPDLEFLRGDPRFTALTGEAGASRG
jgi:tetratricopeptide (TPR) repeat protein